MRVSEWLDDKVREGISEESLVIPHDVLIQDDPDEIIYYREINECGLFCRKNHPFSKVERYDHWFHAKGQDKKAGKHSDEMKWDFVTRDRAMALVTARKHIE